MARIGITYLDVQKAALQLQGQGKLPTVDRVRELLGTGSKTTITEHLKHWKAEQADGQGKLPQELSALVTGLWERLQLQSEQRVNDVQASCDDQIKTSQQSLFQSQQETNLLKQQLHQAEENNAKISKEQGTLLQQLQVQQQSHLQLETRYTACLQQIEDLKIDNARLHQLAHQVQANLEHYQQAMQSLRAELALETEKREANLQRDIQRLKQELSITQQRAATLQEDNQQKNYALDQTKEINITLQQQRDCLNQECQQSNQEIAKLTERSLHLEQSLAAQQKEANNYRFQSVGLEKQTTLLTQQCQHLTEALKQAEDKIESLRDEKLFLVQEKSELIGSLKQLQQSQINNISNVL